MPAYEVIEVIEPGKTLATAFGESNQAFRITNPIIRLRNALFHLSLSLILLPFNTIKGQE